jgi:hypothetical protein
MTFAIGHPDTKKERRLEMSREANSHCSPLINVNNKAEGANPAQTGWKQYGVYYTIITVGETLWNRREPVWHRKQRANEYSATAV